MGNHEITNAKRAYSLKQQKQSPNKKTRVEPRPTCPPLKVTLLLTSNLFI